MVECKPLPKGSRAMAKGRWTSSRSSVIACRQGLTLVHFSAQRQRFLLDRGCIYGRVTRYGGSISRMTMNPVILSV